MNFSCRRCKLASSEINFDSLSRSIWKNHERGTLNFNYRAPENCLKFGAVKHHCYLLLYISIVANEILNSKTSCLSKTFECFVVASDHIAFCG